MISYCSQLVVWCDSAAAKSEVVHCILTLFKSYKSLACSPFSFTHRKYTQTHQPTRLTQSKPSMSSHPIKTRNDISHDHMAERCFPPRGLTNQSAEPDDMLRVRTASEPSQRKATPHSILQAELTFPQCYGSEEATTRPRSWLYNTIAGYFASC